MQVDISTDPARRAADLAAGSLHRLLAARDNVRLLVATGNSQLDFLKYLTSEPDIDWRRIELFHLDEYVGISDQHPASFARYIREKIIVPTGLIRYHLLDGAANPSEVTEHVGNRLAGEPVDLAFAGIGENGHLAFNDPPADFTVDKPYIVVDLDRACRLQQVGEGWFPSLDDVPKQAMTISIRQLMKAHELICVVPDLRKARAVAACLEGEISTAAPASVLRQHPNAWLYLDLDSASLLSPAAKLADTLKT